MQHLPRPDAGTAEVERAARAEEALRESEERFRVVFESASEGIVMVGGDGRILLANARAEEMFGYDRGELSGKAVETLVPERFRGTHVQHRADYFGEPRLVPMGLGLEASGQRKDGGEFPIEMGKSFIGSGDDTRVICFITDITERKRAEEELRESRLMLEDIAQGITESVLLVSKDYRILWANRVALEQTDHEVGDVLGSYCYAVTHLRDRPCEAPFDPCPIQRLQESGKPETQIHTHFDAEGKKIDVEVIAYPVTREEGETGSFVHICRDISERVRVEEALREREEWFRFLSSATLEGVAIHDGGEILHVNEAYARMFGYEPSELIGAQVLDHVAAESRDLVRRNMLSGYEGLYEAVGLRKDGSTLIVEASGKTIPYHEHEVRAVAVRDITERKRVSEEMRHLTARLLEIQEEDRRQVAYDIHDGLGQLITAAAMHLEAFAGHQPPRQPPEVQAEFKKGRHCLQDAVVEMRRMVSELGPLLLEDLGLVEASRRLLADVAERENWEIEFEGDVDGERLDRMVETPLFRIVQEALSNARKHSRTKKLRISFQREGGSLHLEVRDWGQGFDVDSLDRAGHGRRVGLLSMRERATLIGGEFKIESAPSSGTKLTVTVPIAQTPQPVTGQKKVEVASMVERLKGRESARQEITVLIVDDHPMVREGLRSMMHAEGVEVIGEASTGAEAVERVQQLNPQVVLMDVRMPDMDGLAATDVVKRNSPETSVIVVTAYESKEYLRRAIEAGAAGYLLKGMSQESLVDAIRLVKGGGSLIDSRLLGELLQEMGVRSEHLQGAAEGSLEALSPREREVLQLLVQGLTNKEIAQQMHYSVGTVKNVVQRVIEKLGVSDRTQAAVYAVRAGLNLE